jgi:hypothetical protein
MDLCCEKRAHEPPVCPRKIVVNVHSLNDLQLRIYELDILKMNAIKPKNVSEVLSSEICTVKDI